MRVFLPPVRQGALKLKPNNQRSVEKEAALKAGSDYSSESTDTGSGPLYVIGEQLTEQNMTNEGIEGTERFMSPDKGRGLRAVRHFTVGELVFACPAYSYVLTVNERGAYCEQCFTR